MIITNCSFHFSCWNKIWEDDETISSIQCSFEVQNLYVLFVFDWPFVFCGCCFGNNWDGIFFCGYVDADWSTVGTVDFVRFSLMHCQIMDGYTYILSWNSRCYFHVNHGTFTLDLPFYILTWCTLLLHHKYSSISRKREFGFGVMLGFYSDDIILQTLIYWLSGIIAWWVLTS